MIAPAESAILKMTALNSHLSAHRWITPQAEPVDFHMTVLSGHPPAHRGITRKLKR